MKHPKPGAPAHEFRLTLADALAQLPGDQGKRFVTVMRHGSLDVECYAPRGHDPQQPHTRDELYVVIRGEGQYLIGAERTPFGPGDVLFAPAGAVHRFEEFTDDLAVWVFFYGPEGGEAPGPFPAPSHSASTMTRLSVNLNKIALLRNARDHGRPDVLEAARTCLAAGAHGLTVHPRPDERHTRAADVYHLADLLADHPSVEYNIEGNPFEGRYLEHVRAVQPTQATLVPDAPGVRTSDHGWDVARHAGRLTPVVEELRAAGIRVSLFLDPDLDQVEAAARLGVDRIELYTEPYARAFEAGAPNTVLSKYVRAASATQALGLGVNAGHDLDLHNLPVFCAQVPGLLEVSIGHALITDALERGLHAAVKAYLDVLRHPLAMA